MKNPACRSGAGFSKAPDLQDARECGPIRMATLPDDCGSSAYRGLLPLCDGSLWASDGALCASNCFASSPAARQLLPFLFFCSSSAT
jgi:hypothetical protein